MGGTNRLFQKDRNIKESYKNATNLIIYDHQLIRG